MAGPDPRHVVGVPLLPPARVTALGNRVRFSLGRLWGASGPPPVRIIEGVLSFLDHKALVALCQAGVPDVLDRRMTVRELAAVVGADEVQLGRLLRLAGDRGWVKVDRRGRVAPSRVTAFLRADHPGGWRAWVDFAGGPDVWAAVGRVSVRDEGDPFAAANGAPFFEWMQAHPERGRAFDGAMAAGARLHALTLAAGLDWSGVRTVCDVGGGVGALLAALVDRVPSLERGTVFDLPGVVGGAGAVAHPRVDAVGGDFFSEVPAGFDLYLLVNVVHDWGDDDAAAILRRVGEAAGDAGRVVVVEGDPDDRHNGITAWADVLMSALTPGGRERNGEAVARVAAAAGLRLVGSTPLASADVAHELRRSG